MKNDSKIGKKMLERLTEYGRTNKASDIPGLYKQYTQYMTQADPGYRNAMMRSLSGLVSDGLISVNALNPFITLDSDFSVMSTAALDFAVLMPLSASDPMTGPKYILGLAQADPNQDRRLALLSGLMNLGDRRVAVLLHGSWSLLDEEHQVQLTKCWNGNLWAGTIEFFLSWIEAIGNDQQRPFASIAGLLSRMPRESAPQTVQEMQRPFPVTSGTPRLLGEWTTEQYGRVLAPRFNYLERREASPKIIPVVMQAWGLKAPSPNHGLGELVSMAKRTWNSATRLCTPVEDCQILDQAPLVYPLLSWVYFNPLGPTHVMFGVFAPTPTEGLDNAWMLGLVRYHPFMPNQTIYGLLSGEDIRDGSAVWSASNRLFSAYASGEAGFLRSMPTHVYIPKGSSWSLENAREIFWMVAKSSDIDYGELRRGLEEDWLDPWARTQKEFQESLRHLESGSKVPGPSLNQPHGNSSKSDRRAFEEWWALATNADHVRSEQKSLVDAWNGAIGFAGDNLESVPVPEQLALLARAAN